MKFKALLVLFVGFLTSTSFCQAQSIWHPSYLTGASGLSNSQLERIEIKRKTTALVFALSAYEGEITLPKDVCLKAAGDSLPLLSAVAYKHKYNENRPAKWRRERPLLSRRAILCASFSLPCRATPPPSTSFAAQGGALARCWASAPTTALTLHFCRLRRRSASLVPSPIGPVAMPQRSSAHVFTVCLRGQAPCRT